VRKIISILVTVGLVMAFSVVAMPTTGAACGATVVVNSTCACTSANYTIDFDSPVTLLPVNDFISVEFAAGTTFAFLSENDITVNNFPVDDIDDVVITGTRIEFAVPEDAGIIEAGDPVTLFIDNVKNPCVAGDYELTLDYDLACCAGVTFDCAEYTITPLESEYDFFWDSSPTYDGNITFGFVPPFKVCGQDEFPNYELDGKFLNLFDLYLMPKVVGCLSPCVGDDVTVTATITAAPAGANVTLNLSGVVTWYVFDPEDDAPEIDLGDHALGANTTVVWNNAIHFDMVGDYQICVEAWCPGDYTCPTCSDEPVLIADECFDISVYQHKTAVKIPLYRKWNLISLPLVPLEDPNAIEGVLAAYDGPDIISVYYFDCTDGWKVWGDGQSSLTTMEDGKSYWVKVEYSHSDPTKAPGDFAGALWVWGTPQPVPPNSPAAYPVCDGWNMVGLTGHTALADIGDAAYFWSVTYGQLYAWDGDNQMWVSELGGTLPDLQVGEGYWIAVAGADIIYPA